MIRRNLPHVAVTNILPLQSLSIVDDVRRYGVEGEHLTVILPQWRVLLSGRTSIIRRGGLRQ